MPKTLERNKMKDMVSTIVRIVLCIVFLNGGYLYPEVRLPSILANNMVLQHNTVVNIWGWANPGELVTVKASWVTTSASAKTDENGKWIVKLKTSKAGGPYSISIKGENRIVLNNVLLGEVWLCSGQSNMEYTIHMLGGWEPQYADFKKELDSKGFPTLRLCQIAKASSDVPVDTCSASWRTANASTVENFSAVAYFFGRELNKKLHIPIALISSNWGGTPAEAWTAREYLAGKDDLKFYLEAPNSNGWLPGRPSVLYNAMIQPLINYSIRGVIWYQGESNRNDADTYESLFATMIRNWRDKWNEGDFPFYYVQIAPYAYIEPFPSGAYLREAQLMTLAVPNTGMAVTMDIGETRNIHPKNKPEIGRRLALVALARTYGIHVPEYSGPVYHSLRMEANKIRLFFDHAENGLAANGNAPSGFTIADASWNFVPARALIDGKELVVWNDSIVNPVAVRFAFTHTDSSTLFNTEGLPASSFRTDTKPFFARQVALSLSMDKSRNGVTVLMKTYGEGIQIKYTLDGTTPSISSPTYETELSLTKSADIQARAFQGQFPSEYIARAAFVRHKGLGKSITLVHRPSERFPVADNALLDGIKGSLQFNDGRWQGYEGSDLEATIDLGDTISISKISPEFIQAIGSWVFLPTKVEISVSKDGKQYSRLAEIANDESVRRTGAFTKSFTVDVSGIRARFIVVKAKNIGLCPEGHPGAGQKAWMFIDEIVIE